MDEQMISEVLIAINTRLTNIEESIKQMEEIVANVGSQVMPLVDELKDNPMVKMLVGGN